MIFKITQYPNDCFKYKIGNKELFKQNFMLNVKLHFIYSAIKFSINMFPNLKVNLSYSFKSDQFLYWDELKQ